MSQPQNENEKNRINKSSYKTKYPYNKVMVTESGHEFHWDDTPGNERIRIAHKSGTYMEISADGKMVQYNVGNKQEYNKGGITMTIDENGDIKIAGHSRMLVGGGSHIEVAGDAAVTVGGDSLSVVGGNMKAAVAGDTYMGVKGNANMNVSGDVNQEVKGNMSLKVAGNMNLEAQGETTIKGSKIQLN